MSRWEQAGNVWLSPARFKCCWKDPGRRQAGVGGGAHGRAICPPESSLAMDGPLHQMPAMGRWPTVRQMNFDLRQEDVSLGLALGFSVRGLAFDAP